MTWPAAIKRFPSRVGDLLIAADQTGLLLCEFAAGREANIDVERFEAIRSDNAMLDRAIGELKAYFAGDLRTFTVPLPSAGTPFQQRAWSELLTIPYGKTITYAEQARRMGQPKAVRAVGRANGRNHRAIFIPCHRVIGASGDLTGFGGGQPAKRWLIDHERRVAGEVDLFDADLPAAKCAG